MALSSSSTSTGWICMLLVTLTLSLTGSITMPCAAAENEESSKSSQPAEEFVVTLDHENFTEFVSRHNFMVVEFYASWCGACKSLAPEYEKAASILSENDPPVVLAKVDANEEVNKELAVKHDLRGFPTIKILRFGGSVIQDYRGPRDADGIVAYVKKQLGPASIEIRSAEDAASLVNGNDIVLAGIFPEFSGEKFENFTRLAGRLRADRDFGHTTDAKMLPRGDSSTTGPIIRLFKPFDELFVDFQEFDVDVLEKLVEEASTPLITLFSNGPNGRPYLMKFFHNPDHKAMLFLNFTSESIEAFKSKYRDVAEHFKGQGISFLLGDVEVAAATLQHFGLKEDQVPLVIIQTKDAQKYAKLNVEPDQISSWLKDFKDGKLHPYKKSEPIPQINDEPVKLVVADSLQDMVFNSLKNVLLEFYAPWSRHCKEFAPILDEIAVSFQDDVDIVIAKIDATANDYPSETFNIRGYPTLYFKSASGRLLKYDGGKTKEDIVDFIKKNQEKFDQRDSGKDEL